MQRSHSSCWLTQPTVESLLMNPSQPSKPHSVYFTELAKRISSPRAKREASLLIEMDRVQHFRCLGRLRKGGAPGSEIKYSSTICRIINKRSLLSFSAVEGCRTSSTCLPLESRFPHQKATQLSGAAQSQSPARQAQVPSCLAVLVSS